MHHLVNGRLCCNIDSNSKYVFAGAPEKCASGTTAQMLRTQTSQDVRLFLRLALFIFVHYIQSEQATMEMRALEWIERMERGNREL